MKTFCVFLNVILFSKYPTSKSLLNEADRYIFTISVVLVLAF